MIRAIRLTSAATLLAVIATLLFVKPGVAQSTDSLADDEVRLLDQQDSYELSRKNELVGVSLAINTVDDAAVADARLEILADGVPLTDRCHLIPEPISAEDHRQDGASIRFSVPVSDCDLLALGGVGLTAKPSVIEVDREISLSVPPEDSFPQDFLRLPLIVAAIAAAIVLIVGLARAHDIGKSKDLHEGYKPVEHTVKGLRSSLARPGLTWSFKDSILSSFVAIGALLGTVLAATDVLNGIGISGPERSVFVGANLLAAGLLGLAPITFNALQAVGKDTASSRRRVEVSITSNLAADGTRTLELNEATLTYTTNGEVSVDSRPFATQWNYSDRHVVASKVEWHYERENQLDPTERWFLLDVPSASSIVGRADYRYSVSVPVLEVKKVPDADRKDNGTKLVWMEKAARHTVREFDGSFAGLVVASMVLVAAVSLQLGALWSLVDASSLETSERSVVKAFVIAGAFFTLVYLVRVVSRRPEFAGAPDAAESRPEQFDLRRGDVPSDASVVSPSMTYVQVTAQADPHRIEPETGFFGWFGRQLDDAARAGQGSERAPINMP